MREITQSGRELNSKVYVFEHDSWELVPLLLELADFLEDHPEAQASALSVGYDEFDGSVHTVLLAVIDEMP